MLEHRGRAMGTTVHIVIGGGSMELLDALHARLEALESRWSRFIETSEINALNADPDRWRVVSPETALLVARAKTGWEMTGGAFDPTVLDAVVAHGYRTTYHDLRGDSIEAQPARPAVGCAEFAVHLDTCLVHLGAGAAFDPGGIGKGLAADLLVDEAIRAGASGALVNIGGDLSCRGHGPDGDRWLVGLPERPRGSNPQTTIAVTGGGIATSTTSKRRWSTIDGADHHHLVDPRSGRNTAGINSATVVAATGWWAEVVAKQLLVEGMGAPVDTDRAAALVVDDDGGHHRIGDFGRYVR